MKEDPIDEYRGEVPPTPEPATDPYEMEEK